jgi:hypothetical protein
VHSAEFQAEKKFSAIEAGGGAVEEILRPQSPSAKIVSSR